MFVGKLTKEDAQEMANWLYECKGICYYPGHAKLEKDENGILFLTCDAYQMREQHKIALHDFSIMNFSAQRHINLTEEHYREYMVIKFGKEYLDAYHQYIDRELTVFLPKDKATKEAPTL